MTDEQNETQKGTAKQLFFLVKICLNLSPQDFCCVLHQAQLAISQLYSSQLYSHITGCSVQPDISSYKLQLYCQLYVAIQMRAIQPVNSQRSLTRVLTAIVQCTYQMPCISDYWLALICFLWLFFWTEIQGRQMSGSPFSGNLGLSYTRGASLQFRRSPPKYVDSYVTRCGDRPLLKCKMFF